MADDAVLIEGRWRRWGIAGVVAVVAALAMTAMMVALLEPADHLGQKELLLRRWGRPWRFTMLAGGLAGAVSFVAMNSLLRMRAVRRAWDEPARAQVVRRRRGD